MPSGRWRAVLGRLLVALLLVAGTAVGVTATASPASAGTCADGTGIPIAIDNPLTSGQWCAMGQEERDLCASDWTTCGMVALPAEKYAVSGSGAIIDRDGQPESRQDAARHCLWQLILATGDSPGYATRWGLAHELEDPDVDPPSHAMDFHNNEVARGHAQEAWSMASQITDGSDVMIRIEAAAHDICTTLVARAVRVRGTGDVTTTDGVRVTQLGLDDPYNGGVFGDRLVYLTDPDPGPPFSPDWRYPVDDGTLALFRTNWDGRGGIGGYLGAPTGAGRVVIGGSFAVEQQDFAGGSLVRSAYGTFAVRGAVRDAYLRAGGPAGVLGYPLHDQVSAEAGSGQVSYFTGPDCSIGSPGPYGSKAAVYVSDALGAHEMHGCIYDAYLHKSGFGGPGGVFGYPYADEQAAPGGGRVSYMDGSPCAGGQAEPHSAIYWKSAAWGVRGCIFSFYRSIGEGDSPLGFPTSLEYTSGSEIRQNFEHGYISWANNTATPHYQSGTPLVLRSAAAANGVNDDFVSAELGWSGDSYGILRARATSPGSWESWSEVPLGNGEIALLSNANNKFVSAEIGWTGVDYGKLRARADAVGPWERFKKIGNTDGTYSLKSSANGLYVTAELGWAANSAGVLRANSGTIGPWERFTTSTGPMSGCADYGALTTGPGACNGFSTTGTWFSGGGVGLLGRETWTYANGSVRDSSAVYRLSGMDTTHAWRIEAYVPNGNSDATHAHYVITSPGGGTANGYVDQENYTNAWAPVGGVCTSDGTATITLWDDGGDSYPLQVGADAVRAVRTGTLCG
ncbi:hypothetical protein MPTA5024_06610 [Microbispora sp. ATCC PTA-5024]|nr:hypothetical protein MPTA5024_06610 [Microbispora sp. ATCC PTA-5024]